MRYLSRGRSITRKCPRKFYYSYLLDGGYDGTQKEYDPLGLGAVIHAGLEVLFETGDLARALERVMVDAEFWRPTAPEDRWREAQWEEFTRLARGLVAGWYRAHHSRFMEENEVISIEKEILTPLATDIILYSRPDLVVRNRASGRLRGVNFKSASSFFDWPTKWNFDIQAWTEGVAIEKEYGEKIESFIYIGFKKGSLRGGSYSSPLLWGYKEEDGDKLIYSTHSSRYRTKFPVWKESFPRLEDGADPQDWWLSFLGGEIAEEYNITPPIFSNSAMIEDWIDQEVRWESDAEHISKTGTERDKLSHFRQEYNQYNCKKCPFLDVCERRSTIKALVDGGRLVPRSSPISTREALLEHEDV